MMLLVRLSLRNLFRQKRRNVLLGSAMALGIMILIVANSFSHGISDIIFNKIMPYVAGHVAVRFNEKGGVMAEIFRDKARALAAVANEPLIERTDESVGFFMRAIGNGKADNIILVGADTTRGVSKKELKELEESFKMVDGTWKDLETTAVENAAILSTDKARYLNVKKGDVLRIRFRNMFGQDQAARLNVVGIVKNSNIFMQSVVFVEQRRAKDLLGYRSYETASLNLRIKNPQKNSRIIADRIHSRLKPGLAYIQGTVSNKNKEQTVVVFGYKSDDDSKEKFSKKLKITDGTLENALKKNGVVLCRPLARALGAAAGDEISLRYDRKFEPEPARFACKVSAVCEPTEGLGENVVVMNDDKFYNVYYESLPKNDDATPPAYLPKEGDAWYALLSPEWILLKRTANTDEYTKKYKEMGKKKRKSTLIDVSTMYETASDILKLEGVLNLITLSAVLVLFFIILLGVVNTLRMTIRERTREIGTIRAIGMQKNDVRNMFVLETFFLTVFSAAAGVVGGFAVMGLLKQMTFNMSDNPFGMLLVDSHLHFVPTVLGVLGNVLLIVLVAVLTAYFPARRAANLSPANALRHYE
ncbi:MAG TPA: FtsX-like permease family protein [Elusimicrobiota bacterium]|nr:FtsX-like permease family protein [Elusimicrobiota bacterium]